MFNDKVSFYTIQLVSFFSVNTLILQQTGETAVTFIYLPAPPTDDSTLMSYYNNLEICSRHLPPTIFVHGVNTVTSTTL